MSMKIISIYRVVSYLLMLGVLHSALTPVFYDFFSPNGMWFFGTGLALIFLGFLNIAASRLRNTWLLKLTLFANLTGTVYSILITLVLLEIQAFIGLVFHIVVFLSNLLVLIKLNSEYATNK
jgi:sulfite exporter TauE/SafE